MPEVWPVRPFLAETGWMSNEDDRIRTKRRLPDMLLIARLARTVVLRRAEHVVRRFVGDFIDFPGAGLPVAPLL